MIKVFRSAILLLTLFSSVLLYGASGEPEKNKQDAIRKVVIDPGHGGKDPGTSHQKVLEKDIVLSVALKLGKMITDNFPEVEVLYTRKTDVYPTLDERSAFANKAGADLFISIHVNSSKSASARGVETFVMGASKTNGNLDVVMRENDVVMFEEDYTTKYQGYIAGSEESYIMFSLMQYSYQEQSMQLAEIVQKHLVKDINKVDRGAKMEPFLVLWKTAMPSILTEIGFISNNEDRAYMNTDKGQNKIATSLFNAFSEYKSKAEGRSNVVALSNNDVLQAVSEKRDDTQQSSVTATSVKYYVQIAVLNKPKSLKSSDFKSYKGKVTEQHTPSGKYRYVVGGVSTYAEARTLLEKVKKEFNDAYIIALDGDKQIELSEARKKTDK